MTPFDIFNLMKLSQKTSLPTKPPAATTAPKFITAPGNDLSKGYELGPETYRNLIRDPYLNVNQDDISKYFAANPNLQRTNDDRDALQYQLSLAQKFDPSARIVEEQLPQQEGEGFSQYKPAYVEYDKTKAPKSVLGDDFVLTDHNSNVYTNKAQVFDPNYGWITPSANAKPNDNIGWKIAPMIPMAAMSLLGPAMPWLLKAGISGMQQLSMTGQINPISLGLSAASGLARGN